MSILSRYQQLLCSPTQLQVCLTVDKLPDLIQLLAEFFRGEDINDNHLLSEILDSNQQQVIPEAQSFLANWLPIKYDSHMQTISWSLLSDEPFKQPFFDDHISQINRQQLLRSIVRPKTSLQYLVKYQHVLQKSDPTGFIFHLSRCGSTLVSNAFTVLDECWVLSEANVLTNLLLDQNLDESKKKLALSAILAAQIKHRQQQYLLVKFNAWDIYFYSLIRHCFTNVPTVFVIRSPEEILASHSKLAGLHMVPNNKSIESLLDITPTEQLFDYQCNVLQRLMGKMLSIAQTEPVMIVDYQQLPEAIITDIASHFAIELSAKHQERIQQSNRYHSKIKQQVFISDIEQKRTLLNAQQKDKINQQLMPIYLQLMALKA